MKEFDQLLELADILLGPNGCPWDREQTFFTLQPYILEEAHEVLEAIDTQDPNKISEETGDLF
ncbi:MAG TPA: MazG nucleotide pyrophosphohydrolase domain-containing protein, partial [Chlamydiales bacterium]|nr:MazG nucleotide pyrophosphohydrolase domain-containing protein [Chlamydiales bacterium]